MIKELFLSLFEISLTTGLIILLLILLAPFLNKRYAAKWKYWIWIVLAMRLLIPYNGMKSTPSIVVDIPRQMTAPLVLHDVEEFASVPNTEVTASELSEDKQEYSEATRPKRQPVDITLLDFVIFIWLLGCLSILSVHGVSYICYKRQILKNGTSIEDEHILCQFQQLTRELKIRQRVVVMYYSRASSPLVVGFFHPILVLPGKSYNEEEIYYILKHELIHVKRKDICLKLLMMVANAVHWFNPIVWIMRKEAAVDMELSCDERVVLGMSFAVRKAYMETLLSMLHRQGAGGTVLSTQFYGGKQVMIKRFNNILTEKRKKNGISVLVCTIVLTFVLGTLMGCSINEEYSDSPENVVDLHNHLLRGATECPREEYPYLYENMEVLIGERQAVLNSILYITYGKPNEKEEITAENGGIYYLLTEKNSQLDVVEDLANVYTDSYIADVLIPKYFEGDHPLFLEDQGNLYRSGADGWQDGLRDGWTIWKLNDKSYYIQGYEDNDVEEDTTMVIITVIELEEKLLIDNEITLDFL